MPKIHCLGVQMHNNHAHRMMKVCRAESIICKSSHLTIERMTRFLMRMFTEGRP